MVGIAWLKAQNAKSKSGNKPFVEPDDLREKLAKFFVSYLTNHINDLD